MNNFDIENFEPIVVKNFLSEEHIKNIIDEFYGKINNNITNKKKKYFDFQINEKMGMFMHEVQAKNNPELFEYIEKRLKEVFGIELSQPSCSLQYLKYTAETGFEPNVRPHVDRVDKEQPHMIAFSLSINNANSEPWSMYINKTKYDLEDHDALFFNATNTLHWRPSRKFSGEDYFDVLVFRFCDNASPVILPEDLQKTLEEQRIDLFLNSYY
jgi:hypothetical protein